MVLTKNRAEKKWLIDDKLAWYPTEETSVARNDHNKREIGARSGLVNMFIYKPTVCKFDFKLPKSFLL